MRAHTLFYLGRQGVRGTKANRLMAFASIGVLTVCFLLLGVFTLLAQGLRSAGSQLGGRLSVTVFLEDMPAAHALALARELEGWDEVAASHYASPQENLQELAAQLGEPPDLLLDNPGDNPLLASVRLELADAGAYDTLAARLEQTPGVAALRNTGETARAVTALQAGVMRAGGAVLVLLVGVSVFVISNTIRLTIFNRRREIAVMRVVGASGRFIRLPFQVEGMFLGLLAGGLALGVLGAVYFWGSWWLEANPGAVFGGELLLRYLPMPGQVFPHLALAFALLGGGVGWLGSRLFVSKYLRV